MTTETQRGHVGGQQQEQQRQRQRQQARSSKVDQIVDAQKGTMDAFSTFAGTAAALAMGGNYQPDAWVNAWKTLSNDLAEVTKKLLED